MLRRAACRGGEASGTGRRRRHSCGADLLARRRRRSCGVAARYGGEQRPCSRPYTAPARATAAPTQLRCVPTARRRRRGCAAAARYGGERPFGRPPTPRAVHHDLLYGVAVRRCSWADLPARRRRPKSASLRPRSSPVAVVIHIHQAPTQCRAGGERQITDKEAPRFTSIVCA